MADRRQGGSTRMAAPKKPRISNVKLAQILIHYDARKTQLREEVSSTTVAIYSEQISEGTRFPRIELVCANDGKFYIADGWHRVQAHKAAGRTSIRAFVHEPPDGRTALNHAISLAIMANTKHGLPMKQGDKLRKARAALQLPEYQGQSYRALVPLLGISKSTLARAYAELVAERLIPERRTGQILPDHCPDRYRTFKNVSDGLHPLCCREELREDVFAQVGKLTARDVRAWCYAKYWYPGCGLEPSQADAGFEVQPFDDDLDNYHDAVIVHWGLVPDRVVVFTRDPGMELGKGLPVGCKVYDPTVTVTYEQKAAREANRSKREVAEAWKRLKAHPDVAVHRAVALVVATAENEDFRDDLQTVLPKDEVVVDW